MEIVHDYQRVLTAFATYGYRKASMAELAVAAGISRQTLYNRFQDKQAVLAWAVGAWAEQAEISAQEALRQLNVSAQERVVDFFVAWVGKSVPVVRGLPHGAEIFEMASSLLHSEVDNLDTPAWTALIAFIQAEGMASDATRADEAAYVLLLASKGLMLRVSDVAAYQAGMRRVVAYVLDTPSPVVIAAK